MSLQAEKIVVLDEQQSEIDLIAYDIEVNDLETNLLEYDRDTIRNIRRKAGLVMDLITSYDQVVRTLDPPRTRHEINGGYKIASRRGARLNEVEVFNLYFKFRSHLRGDGIALMYRTKDNLERIILLPDGTLARIAQEDKLYRDIARELIFRGDMNPDVQSKLIENLRLLNIHERCAQSLQHEYGHILHWREFERLALHTNLDVFDWFLDSGYYDIVDMRMPEFAANPVLHKVAILKESLVEDYRISLNLSENSDTFILPNKFCHFGDFQMPELLEEGVRIMKSMLNNQIRTDVKRPASSSELDSLEIIKSVSATGFKSGWKAGGTSSTKATIKRDREMLMSEAEQVAATIENA